MSKNNTPLDSISKLASQLRSLADSLDRNVIEEDNWPREQLRLADEYGINRWFVPVELGGWGWSSAEIAAGYLPLSAACLTTTFIVTQRAAAIRRIVASENIELRDELLTGILTGESAATVGISHLTTSRRHLNRPVLLATETPTGYLLDGFTPWVTGAWGAQTLVIGAQRTDGQHLLFAVPKNADGITVEPGLPLVALSASRTGPVQFDRVEIEGRYLLAGPAEDVLTTGSVSATGSFQTSGLAIGLASAAIDFIRRESERRPEFREKQESLQQQWDQAKANLMTLAAGETMSDYSTEQLRIDANSLVLRSTQAALVAAKGAGFVTGHPVGRWCREALFFLVWSCPQAVANANMCELVRENG